jgi:hypothetical protein
MAFTMADAQNTALFPNSSTLMALVQIEEQARKMYPSLSYLYQTNAFFNLTANSVSPRLFTMNNSVASFRHNASTVNFTGEPCQN